MRTYRFSQDKGDLVKKIHRLMKSHKSFDLRNAWSDIPLCRFVYRREGFYMVSNNLTLVYCTKLVKGAEKDDGTGRRYLDLYLNWKSKEVGIFHVWWDVIKIVKF